MNDDDHDKLTKLQQAFDDLVETLTRVLGNFRDDMTGIRMLLLGTAATAIVSTVVICVTIILRT